MKTKKLLVIVLGAMMIGSGMQAEVTPGSVIRGTAYTGAGVASLVASFYTGCFALRGIRGLFASPRKIVEIFGGALALGDPARYKEVLGNAYLNFVVGSVVAGLLTVGLVKYGTRWIDTGLREMGVLKAKEVPATD